VQYKDRKAICADLKKIYGAVNLDDAEYAKEEFREKWDKKYPSILRSWDANWAELTTFFSYPEQIRHLIYTTNAVEAYHRMVRKFTKTKLMSFGKLEQPDSKGVLDIFTDKSEIASYAIDSVAALVSEGLIVGSNNKIMPKNNTSRAEAAEFVYRLYNNYK
jgi:hypothetical protein